MNITARCAYSCVYYLLSNTTMTFLISIYYEGNWESERELINWLRNISIKIDRELFPSEILCSIVSTLFQTQCERHPSARVEEDTVVLSIFIIYDCKIFEFATSLLSRYASKVYIFVQIKWLPDKILSTVIVQWNRNEGWIC